MAKFCTKCGKKLKDGEKCTCETVSVQSNDFSSLMKQVLEDLKGIILNPIDTIRNNKDDDKFNLSLITTAIYGIVMGLFVMALSKALYSSIASIFSFGMSDYTSLLDSTSGYQIEIPYFKIFICGFICSVGTMFLMALISYIISSKLLKNETTYKSVFNTFAISTNILIITLLLATLCTVINIKLTLVVYLVGGLLNSYYNVKGIEIATNVDENKLGYTLMPSVLIAPFVVAYIVSKILF